MIKIVQFSDFHLESEELCFRKKDLLNAFLKDVENYFEEKNTIFVFTGDCLDKGGIAFKDKDGAFKQFEEHFIQPILEKFKIGKDRFFLVPGNHDTYRDKVDDFRELGLKQKLLEPNQINNFINKVREGKETIPRIEPFKKFEKLFYKDIRDCNITLLDSNFKFVLNGKKVGIACLNTSWRCFDDEDKDSLLIGENQISNSIEYLQDCNIKIALGHHPIDWLLEADRNIIKPKLEREFNFYLYGHTHKLDASFSDTFFGKIFYNNACATLADYNLDENYANGYNIIEIMDKKLKINYRKYNLNKNKFITYGEAGNADGYSLIDIPSYKEQNENFEVLNIIDSLTSKIETLDEDLIIYNENSIAPCKLKSVFVEPTITNYPDPNAVESEELIEYSIDDIIDNENSFIIFGTKESGKTILLNRIFIEYLENGNSFIPILFNFREIGNRKIITLIKNFINKPTTEVNELLLNKKIVLLIDDFSFDDRYSYTIKEIKNFIKKHSIRIVCTSNLLHITDIPTSLLENNADFNFETGYIQNLSGLQIKELIKNWFEGENVDYQDKLEQLLKSFFELSLPRNPLTVSIFIWIIDTQEKKPINTREETNK